MHTLFQISLVAFGSALGGLARWGVHIVAGHLVGTAFPWGTLLINISGSFFLGWFITVLERLGPESGLLAGNLKLLIAVGFTGAFTTFSTFEVESHSLLRDGKAMSALTYAAASVFLGLLAVQLGILLARGR